MDNIENPILTGAAIVAIGRLTRDPLIARYLYDAGKQLAIQSGVDFINGQHIREAQSIVRRAMNPVADTVKKIVGGTR